MAVTINKLVATNMGVELPHTDTRVKYTATSGRANASFNVSGTIVGDESEENPTTQLGENIGQAEEVRFGTKVTSIGDWALSGCQDIKTVVIPNTVTSIGNHAFYYAGARVDAGPLMVPGNVTSIGAYAFTDSGFSQIIFLNKDKSEVQSMTNYPFGLYDGRVIVCSDGSFTVEGQVS